MSLLTGRKFALWVGLFGAVAAAAVLAAPMIGAEAVQPFKAAAELFSEPPHQHSPQVDIFFFLRLPRICLAFLAGSGLSVVGLVFQALLRNPLATPYTLGVAGGGSFGAVVAIFLPTLLPALDVAWGPFGMLQVFSFAGSLTAVGLIYALARSSEGISTTDLLLAGVTLGMIFSALIMAVRYFADPDMLVGMDRWLMGSLDVNGWLDILSVIPLFVPAAAGLMMSAPSLDVISFGEQMAAGRGVNVKRLQMSSFFWGSLLTASVVAFAGPIGFVGLIVPHTVRRLVGADHRLLMPCVFLAGGAFLVVCDTLARTMLAPTELPVGVITSLLGGPFFIYLLVQARRGGRLWGRE